MIIKFYHKGEFILEKEIDLDIVLSPPSYTLCPSCKGAGKLIEAFKYYFKIKLGKYKMSEFDITDGTMNIHLRDQDARDFKLNSILNI